MTTRYCDPDASGDNDGTSWVNAYETFQQAADNAVAGDVVYCRGTETLTARVDFDTNSGTNAGGFIKFIGCNEAGNVDGTRFVLDGDSGNYAGIYIIAAIHTLWFENIRVTNCDGGSNGYGVYASVWNAGYGCVYINFCSDGNYYGMGIGTNSLMYRCVAYSNTAYGIASIGSAKYLFCASRDNGASGFYNIVNLLIGCISHGNTDDGINLAAGCLCFNCVIDGNTDDGVVNIATTVEGSLWTLIGCRITNHSGSGDIGLNANTEVTVSGYCYFEDNDGDNIQNATLHQFIPIVDGSTTSNVEDQADTTEGYTSTTSGSEDFNLRSDATLRRTAITIPWT